MSSKGYFIVLEGVDGCGKGTEMGPLFAALCNKYGAEHVVRTKEPGGTAIGEAIRSVVFPPEPNEFNGSKNMAPGVVDLLFLASHIQNYKKVVEPALRAGKVVLSDRWWYSQEVYQKLRVVPEQIKRLYHDTVSGEIQPDLAFFFMGDAERFLKRAFDRGGHEATKAWADPKSMHDIQVLYRSHFGPLPEAQFVDVSEMSVDEVHRRVWHLTQQEMRGYK